MSIWFEDSLGRGTEFFWLGAPSWGYVTVSYNTKWAGYHVIKFLHGLAAKKRENVGKEGESEENEGGRFQENRGTTSFYTTV